MIENLQIRCQRSALNWRDAVHFILFELHDDGRVAVAEPLMMKQGDRSELVPTPTFELSISQAQRVMDDLWTCGLRPSEGTGSAGAMAATERHLGDMRAIAAKFLQVEMPVPKGR